MAPRGPRPAAQAADAPVHLIKLCVGVSSIAELEEWIAECAAEAAQAGRAYEQIHVTRSMPTRREALLEGGSLYWVIAGEIAARQRLVGIDPYVRKDGTPACALRLDREVVKVAPRPFRPFQGWRYLTAADAPPDLAGTPEAELPPELSRELRSLGLL